MTDEALTLGLDEDYASYQKQSAIKQLVQRGELTIAQLSKVLAHERHGAVLGTITLQDLFDAIPGPKASSPTKAAKAAAPAAKGAKKTAKKVTKAATPAKKAAKKPAKAAPAPAKKAAKKGEKPAKADKGREKPRLDYETGCKEILAAMKTSGKPVARGDLEKATGYIPVQVRAFCKRLLTDGKIVVSGKGGRSTRYTLK